MAAFRAVVKINLQPEGQRRFFEKYRGTFFMLDKFPENERRFPLTFEECLPQEQ